MSNTPVQRRCVVCGFLLPNQSRESLIDRGFAIRKGDGSCIFHCGHHQPVEVLAAMEGVPKFTISKLEEKK